MNGWHDEGGAWSRRLGYVLCNLNTVASTSVLTTSSCPNSPDPGSKVPPSALATQVGGPRVRTRDVATIWPALATHSCLTATDPFNPSSHLAQVQATSRRYTQTPRASPTLVYTRQRRSSQVDTGPASTSGPGRVREYDIRYTIQQDRNRSLSVRNRLALG